MVRNGLRTLRGLIDDRLQSLVTKAGWLASIKLTSPFNRAMNSYEEIIDSRITEHLLAAACIYRR